MKAKLFNREIYIGYADLKVWDKSMGVLGGNFVPNTKYENIRKVVCDYNDPTNQKSESKYYSLKLNCQLSNEIFLLPQGGILIEDLEELELSDLKISIGGIRYEFVKNYFEQPKIKTEILEPWESITIKQKLAFEDELCKELGMNKKWSINDLFKINTNKHKLFGAEFSAICKRGDSDDILFELQSETVKEQFAVVHLSWAGKKEKNVNWPSFKLFNNFKEFTDQMIIDNEEY